MTCVIVPRGGTCPHREAAWGWVRGRYERSGLTVIEGRCDGEWSKAVAVADALTRTSDDLLVVADADVWCDELDLAITAVEDGARFAVPHRTVFRLAPSSTARVLLGAEPNTQMICEEKHLGKIGGGIVVLTRTTYDEVPLDPRFVGWGREDQSWAGALCTFYGTPWRGRAPLWHLWHPPQRRPDRHHGNDTTEALFKRYCSASGNEHMKALIAEARACHSNASLSVP